MAAVMKVKNVEEAIALAHQLKDSGQYNWFRGQIEGWPPKTSFERKVGQDSVKYSKYENKIGRFLNWAKAQKGLEYLADPKNIHALFAVLQHYGVPTNYIDFSIDPSVAGFFASDCDTPPESGTTSVIYCLNTADLLSFHSTIAATRPELAVELISVDVSNLWRLQAQHGHFVYVNHDWYHYYDMDRIEFPWDGSPAYPPRNQIYPDHKSALELLLDQYFQAERQIEANETFEELTRENVQLTSFFVESLPNNYNSEHFSTSLNELPQWNDSALADWNKPSSEVFDATVRGQICLSVRCGVAAPKPHLQIYDGVLNALKRQQGLRRSAIDWKFSGLPGDVDAGILANYTRAAWNGMRNLPYEDQDIAAAFRSLVVLSAIPSRLSYATNEILSAFQEWVPDAMQVEFGLANGAGSRGYCSEAGLLSALDEKWVSEWIHSKESYSAALALRSCYSPKLMFDFMGLKKLFAEQIIPSQIARDREFVLYNPAQLETFGLP